MENENQFDHLLIRYLLNETNKEENLIVLQWINADEHNKDHFDKLVDAWNLISVKREIDAIDIDDQWSRFQEVSHINQETVLTRADSFSGRSIEELHKPYGRSRLYKILVASAVAASIVLVLGAGYLLLNTQYESSRTLVKADKEKITGTPAIIRHEVNYSGKLKQVALADGSKVFLYDSSELSFPVTFVTDRHIRLIGKAEFSVAKDSTHPFIVNTDDIFTKALGTKFLVTNRKEAKNIFIRLYEGKVVIHSSADSQRKLAMDYYLLPGDELIYNRARSTVSLKKFKVEKRDHQNTEEGSSFKDENPSVPQNNSGSWYMFNNQTLSHVFDQLHDMYNVEIEYSKSAVNDKYFIGRFNKSDSIDKILRQIATLNNLTVTKENGKFIISR